MTHAKLTASLLKLPSAKRLQLAHDLWDSVLGEPPDFLELSPAEKKELDRRIESHRRNPKAVMTWEQVKAKVRRGRRT